MAVNGYGKYADVEGKLTDVAIASRVLTTMSGLSVLTDPRVVSQNIMDFTGKKGKIPTMDAVPILENVGELEDIAAQTPKFGSHDIEYEKDSALFALSDEEIMFANGADKPLTIMEASRASEFAYTLDKKIARKLDQTPQTGTEINLTSKSFLVAFGEAQKMLAPYYCSAVVVGDTVAGMLYDNIGKQMFTGATTADLEKNIGRVPGTNIPIITSHAVEEIDNDVAYFVSNMVPGVVYKPGKTQIFSEHDLNLGGYNYRMDVFRIVDSNIRQTSSNTNLGVVEIEMDA